MIGDGWLRRAAGLGLLLLVVLPLFTLLGPAAGFPGAQAAEVGRRAWTGLWLGAAGALAAATLLSAAVPGPRLEAWWAAPARLLRRPSSRAFALAAGAASALLTLAYALGVLHGKPALGIAHVQLLHARYLAEGMLAAPPLELSEFWNIQFMVEVPKGWISQYPPFHVGLLALGLASGAEWLVGPLLMGVTVAFTAASADRLLPERPEVARTGAALVALSPFLIGLAGSYMTHSSAAAAAAAALYCALRARDGSVAWAAGTGAATALVVGIRPLAGVVFGLAFTLGAWTGSPGKRPAPRWILRRLGAAALGALPFGLALGAYNAHFFGSPFRFGYLAATGPSHALGFHMDPYGNLYGPAEALGYTSVDLLTLGRDLLATPVSAVALIGAYLLLRRPVRGERLLLLWALVPAAANVFFYQHDHVLGPRMLGETGPAWAVLAALAGVELVRACPTDRWRLGRASVRSVLGAALVLSLGFGLLYQGPRWLAGFGDRVAPPVAEPPGTDGPSLVFVHETWQDRLGARLAARGLRIDSLRTVLRRNSPCRVELLLALGLGLPEEARPDAPPFASVEALEAECRRQAASDRLGALGLTGLLWQGDLPGLPPRGAMYVRDLGPEENRRLLERHPEREPHVLLPVGGDRGRLVPYEEGMRRLWEPPAERPRPPGSAPSPG